MRRWLCVSSTSPITTPRRIPVVLLGAQEAFTDIRHQILIRKLDLTHEFKGVYHDGLPPTSIGVDTEVAPPEYSSVIKPVSEASAAISSLDSRSLVVVGLDLESRAESVRMALDAGHHVICEAPMTLEPEVAESLMALALSKKLLLHVSYPKTFEENFNMLRQHWCAASKPDTSLRVVLREPRVTRGFRYQFNEEKKADELVESGWNDTEIIGEYMSQELYYMLHMLYPVEESIPAIDIDEVRVNDLAFHADFKLGSNSQVIKLEYNLLHHVHLQKVWWDKKVLMRIECPTWQIRPWVDVFVLAALREMEYVRGLIRDIDADQASKYNAHMGMNLKLYPELARLTKRLMDCKNRGTAPHPKPQRSQEESDRLVQKELDRLQIAEDKLKNRDKEARSATIARDKRMRLENPVDKSESIKKATARRRESRRNKISKWKSNRTPRGR